MTTAAAPGSADVQECARLQGTGLLSGGVQQYLASCRIVSMDVCCPFCMRRAPAPAAHTPTPTHAAQVSSARQHCSAAPPVFPRAPGTVAALTPARQLRWLADGRRRRQQSSVAQAQPLQAHALRSCRQALPDSTHVWALRCVRADRPGSQQ